jgi:glycosyltransferase involved in cell wall biosynthesis
MMPKISIVVCAYNEEPFIGDCLTSVLQQSYVDFELILVDDGSTDDTGRIVTTFADTRLSYHRNSANMGITQSKNIGLSHAKGEYIFFTDADCVADPDWLKNSLNAFADKKTGIVEGKILPMDKEYVEALSDKIPVNASGGRFATGNIAYRAACLDRAGRKIDLKYSGYEDRELGLRTQKICDYAFCPESIVRHQYKKHTVKSFLAMAKRIPAKVCLVKEYKDSAEVYCRILRPHYLLSIIFPPLILVPIFKSKVRSFKDLSFIPLLYISAIYMRYLIWKTALREKAFIL